jgi:hypothetical protein
MSDNALSTFVYDSSSDFEQMDHGDKILPRVRLIQPTSPEATDDNPINPGSFIDSSIRQIVVAPGKTTKFLLLMWWKEWLEWNSNKQAPKAERLLSKSNDPMGALASICRSREKVIASDGKEMFRVTEVYNAIGALPEVTGDYTGLFMFQFSRTAHYPFKVLLNSIDRLKISDPNNETSKIKAPLFGAAWEFGSERKRNDKNETWFVPKFGAATLLDKDTLMFLAPIATRLREDRKTYMAQASAAHDEETDAPTKVNNAAPDNSPF